MNREDCHFCGGWGCHPYDPAETCPHCCGAGVFHDDECYEEADADGGTIL